MKIEVTEDAYYTGIHPYSFRKGEQGKIIGVEIRTPENLKPRACFKIEYSDGFVDYAPVSDNKHYNITEKYSLEG